MGKYPIRKIGFIAGILAMLIIGFMPTPEGLTLVGISLFLPPRGEIDPTVLTAYGETLTFVGALIGIDYHYREKGPKGPAAL